MSEPLILYVPGIKPKPPVAEQHAMLWRCLLEGVRRADAAVAQGLARSPEVFRLVSWAHVFYDTQRDLALDLPGIERLLALPGPTPEDIRDATSWRRRLKRAVYLLCDRFPPLFELARDPTVRETLHDTWRYLRNQDGDAVRVRQIVTDALLDAWRDDRRVLLIGHSLGSVIAFDVLWELSHRFVVPGQLDLFVSIGSPLGLGFVRAHLLGAHERDARRFPTNIRRWRNLAAMGELIALDRSLAQAWAPMRDLGLVEEISERLDLQTYFRGQEGLNLHKCYGYMATPVLGATVAGWWREQARLAPA